MIKPQKQNIDVILEKIKERDWNLILRYTFRDLGLLILLTLIGIGIWGLIL